MIFHKYSDKRALIGGEYDIGCEYDWDYDVYSLQFYLFLSFIYLGRSPEYP